MALSRGQAQKTGLEEGPLDGAIELQSLSFDSCPEVVREVLNKKVAFTLVTMVGMQWPPINVS